MPLSAIWRVLSDAKMKDEPRPDKEIGPLSSQQHSADDAQGFETIYDHGPKSINSDSYCHTFLRVLFL